MMPGPYATGGMLGRPELYSHTCILEHTHIHDTMQRLMIWHIDLVLNGGTTWETMCRNHQPASGHSEIAHSSTVNYLCLQVMAV